MTKLINKSKLTTFTNKLWDKISNSFVSKTKENLVTGKTTLLDGRLLHNALSVVNNTNAIYTISDNTSWCGSPNLTVSANTKISYVCIAVKDDLEIGTQLNNIKLAAVKSNDNQVYRILTVDSALVVKNTLGHISSSKMIMIPINTAFDTQVYFIAGFNGMKWGNTPRGSNWPTIWPEGRSFPAVGTTLKTNRTNYVPQWFVLSEELGLNDVVTSVNTKASKNDSNTFDSTNIFNANVKLNDTVDVKYKHYIQQPLSNTDSIKGSEWVVYFDRNVYIPTGSYVTYLDIRVTDEASVGSALSNIYIYEVHRGDRINDDRIVNVKNSNIIVSNVTGYGNCIRIQLDKTFQRDTYYILGQKIANGGKILIANDNKNNIRHAIISDPFVLNQTHSISSKASLTNDKVIHRYNIEAVRTLQDDICDMQLGISNSIKYDEVGNEANKIPRIGADGRLPSSILPPEQNGGVRMVNGQSPVDGNVTVLAEHIKYVNGENTTVKGAIDNKVNISDTVTSSQAGKIVKLDDNGKLNDNMLSSSIIKSNQDNTFTKRNTFDGHSPTVHRLFTRKHINSHVNNNSNLATYQHNKYFAPVNEVYTDRNKRITHLLLPVRGASVGEQIAIDVFAFNNNKRLIQVGKAKKYPVVDEEIAGCKCVKIDFDIDSGTNGIGFGFMIMSSGVGAACVQGGSNVAWTSNTRPTETTTLNPNENISFPYKICYETTSELVTRFELENVTQMYPKTLVGEMKQLSYDAGNSLDDGMNTWLKANGQAINSNDYPELYEKFNTSRTDDNIEVSIPSIDSQAGYYYICAK